MMFRSNMGFAESLVWEALRQLAVAWPTLKMATMASFNRLLDAGAVDRHLVEHGLRVGKRHIAGNLPAGNQAAAR